MESTNRFREGKVNLLHFKGRKTNKFWKVVKGFRSYFIISSNQESRGGDWLQGFSVHHNEFASGVVEGSDHGFAGVDAGGGVVNAVAEGSLADVFDSMANLFDETAEAEVLHKVCWIFIESNAAVEVLETNRLGSVYGVHVSKV